MFVKVTKEELAFIQSCVANDRKLGLARFLEFDTSEHDEMLNKLGVMSENITMTTKPFIVEFTYDNGAVLEDMRAVCMAFDEEDARAIIHSIYSKASDDYARIKSIREFGDNDIMAERV